MNKIIDLPSEYTTETIAQRLAQCFSKLRNEISFPFILTFQGEIGAGKTTFIRAFLRALGVNTAIKSPTFSLVESYQVSQWNIHHFDLYRIQEESELEYIGFRDFFEAKALCCIEWPERAPYLLEQVDVACNLRLHKTGREMEVEALTRDGDNIVSCLTGEK